MPSPFTANFSDGQQITVDGKTFEYVLANNLFKNVTQGGGTVSFSITVAEASATVGSGITIERNPSDLLDFTSNGIAITVTIDGINASFTLIDSNTISAVVPTGVALGTGKIVSVAVTPTGQTAIESTTTIEIVGSVQLVYASDGDTNGLIYYLGTQANTVSFANPHPGSITALASHPSAGAGNPGNALDRGSLRYSSNNVSNNWWGISLPQGILTPSHFSLRNHPTYAGGYLRNFKFQASTASISSVSEGNAATWVDLFVFSGTINYVTGADAWRTQSITSSTAYRSFRIQLTGATSDSNSVLSLGEFEIYGELVD